MNTTQRILPGLLSLLACLALPAWSQETAAPAQSAAPAPAPAPATTMVIFKTALGDIHIAVETERAPVTAANFLRYVDAKRFDGITFYRAHKVSADGKYAIVQGGLQNNSRLVYKPIAHESPLATGLSHVDGAISMAREAPGTATADFFIVVGDLVSMDGKPGGDPGYAVFGRVVSGMDVVRAMLELPRSEDARNPVMKGQMLATPVKVESARRAP
ncbi:MAG TPA: peptidylprolyl isomerase [Steroidobacteraceae bacterium]|nr:peptidylprolyl isomerase [Steroidobacteraceae bacterium]